MLWKTYTQLKAVLRSYAFSDLLSKEIPLSQ